MGPDSDRLLARALAEGHPADAARVLEGFAFEEAAALLEEWAPRPAATVLEQMVADAAAECVARMPAATAWAAIEELDLDSAAAVLRHAPAPVQEAILGEGDARRVSSLRLLLASREGTAGALLDPLVVTLAPDVQAGQALERVRRAPERVLDYLYVVDRAGTLVGVTSLRELLVAPVEATVEGVMRTGVMRLHAGDGLESIVAHPGWNEFHALPVVDAEERFLGVLRYETLRRLETGRTASSSARAVSVAVSLGELYWLGLRGLLEGLGTVAAGEARGQRDDGR